MRWVPVLAAVGMAMAAGCGSSSSGGDGGTPPTGPTITIQGFSFNPVDMTVDAGTAISIINNDSTAHTVTSEAKDNDFTPGAVAGVSFDSGQIAGSGGGGPSSPPTGPYANVGATITIPSTAPSGTVIPYFCQNHKGSMATPNGHITVR